MNIIKMKKNKIGINKPRTWMIQEYINDPLLLNGKKFHLRILTMLYYKNKKEYFYLFNRYEVFSAKNKYKKNN